MKWCKTSGGLSGCAVSPQGWDPLSYSVSKDLQAKAEQTVGMEMDWRVFEETSVVARTNLVTISHPFGAGTRKSNTSKQRKTSIEAIATKSSGKTSSILTLSITQVGTLSTESDRVTLFSVQYDLKWKEEYVVGKAAVNNATKQHLHQNTYNAGAKLSLEKDHFVVIPGLKGMFVGAESDACRNRFSRALDCLSPSAFCSQ